MDIENMSTCDMWTQSGEREGGMNWEIRLDIYTLLLLLLLLLLRHFSRV